MRGGAEKWTFQLRRPCYSHHLELFTPIRKLPLAQVRLGCVNKEMEVLYAWPDIVRFWCSSHSLQSGLLLRKVSIPHWAITAGTSLSLCPEAQHCSGSDRNPKKDIQDRCVFQQSTPSVPIKLKRYHKTLQALLKKMSAFVWPLWRGVCGRVSCVRFSSIRTGYRHY